MVRFRYVHNLAISTNFFDKIDNIAFWSMIELGAGVVAGCLATLRPLYTKVSCNTRNLTSCTSVQIRRLHRSMRSKQNMVEGQIYCQPDTSASPSDSSTASSQAVKSGAQDKVYLTSVFGGLDHDEEEALEGFEFAKKVQDNDETRYPPSVWSTNPERAAIWPYASTERVDRTSLHHRGISRVVDIDVLVSNHPGSASVHGIETSVLAGREGGNTSTSGNADDGLPEWEKLPDLRLQKSPAGSRSGSRSSSRSRNIAWPLALAR